MNLGCTGQPGGPVDASVPSRFTRKTTRPMFHYFLRNVPPTLLKRVRERAHGEGRSVRTLLLRLLDDYAAGRIHPSDGPPGEAESWDVASERDQGKRRVALQVQLLAEGAGLSDVEIRWDDESRTAASVLSLLAVSDGRRSRRSLQFTFTDLEDMPADESVSRAVQHRVRTWFLAGLADTP